MDQEPVAAAGFANLKYRRISLLLHLATVAGVFTVLMKLPHRDARTSTLWLKTVGSTAMIAAASWSFMQSRKAGQTKRLLRLMGGQQLSFAIVFLAWFIPWEPAEIAITFASLAVCLWFVTQGLSEQQALNAQIRAQLAEAMRPINEAKSRG